MRKNEPDELKTALTKKHKQKSTTRKELSRTEGMVHVCRSKNNTNISKHTISRQRIKYIMMHLSNQLSTRIFQRCIWTITTNQKAQDATEHNKQSIDYDAVKQKQIQAKQKNILVTWSILKVRGVTKAEVQARLLQSVEIRGTRTVRKPPPLYNIVTKSIITHCCCDIASSFFSYNLTFWCSKTFCSTCFIFLLLSIQSEPLSISYLQSKVLIHHNAESQISVRPFFLNTSQYWVKITIHQLCIILSFNTS